MVLYRIHPGSHYQIASQHTQIMYHCVQECEARNVYDTDLVEDNQFKLDWNRIAEKSRFRRLVGRTDQGVCGDKERLEDELAEVREEVKA